MLYGRKTKKKTKQTGLEHLVAFKLRELIQQKLNYHVTQNKASENSPYCFYDSNHKHSQYIKHGQHLQQDSLLTSALTNCCKQSMRKNLRGRQNLLFPIISLLQEHSHNWKLCAKSRFPPLYICPFSWKPKQQLITVILSNGDIRKV